MANIVITNLWRIRDGWASCSMSLRLLFWANDVELTNSWGRAHGKVIGHYILVSLFPVHITHTYSRLALQRDQNPGSQSRFYVVEPAE